ncbi:MAG: hypothetical protein JW969_15965 [Spirochaetales bacterium]|nr:hypothetical protein [Spirochaetales bacterium]
MKQSYFKLAALFLLSVALIAYEIAVMRTFSVGSWSNFGSMVISIALLGFGLSGTLLTFLQKKIKKAPNAWLATTAILFMPAMALAHILTQLVPFNPVMITVDATQFLWIGAYYLIYAVPFFIGALFIGVAFIVLSSQIYQLYFWNMVGSGIGGFVVLASMYLLPPDLLILPLLFISLITAILCFIRFDMELNRLVLNPVVVLICFLVFAVSFVSVIFLGKIKVSEFKPISYARQYKDIKDRGGKPDYHSFGPTGEMYVYSSSYFHFAPGLSDMAGVELAKIPENAFKGLYIDGNGPIGIQRKLDRDEEGYFNYLPMASSYRLKNKPKVLLIRLGGGTGIFTALHFDSQAITVLENDPAIINLIGNVDLIRNYNGGLLDNKKVNIVSGEPRAFCATTRDKYDIVEIGLIDSVGLSDTGGYPVNENYTYTAEAFSDYFKCLDRDGLVSVTVWNRLTPPRNVPRLLTTIYKSLEDNNIAEPGKHLFVFDVLLSTATVLIKKSPFTEQEIDSLRQFCRAKSFNAGYYPGMPERNKDFNAILVEYVKQFSVEKNAANRHSLDLSGNADTENAPVASTPDAGPDGGLILDQNDLYHFTIQWLNKGKSRELFDKYVFDIRPAVDDKPYYTAYLKPESIGMFMDQLGDISEEWGYLLLLGTLVQSIIFGILIIIIPMIGRRQELFKGRKGTFGVILYYACLGLGYMLVEIFLMQRLVFFLGDPIFSTSVVITSMLVISGLGSLTSDKFARNKSRFILMAVSGIGLSLLFYIFGLTFCLNLLLGVPGIIKGLLAIVFIAPAAFFMGMPFPTGLSTLSANRQRLLPWAWGMNGALSVTGSVIAKLVSISAGFPVVLTIAIVLYLLAGLVFKANESPAKPRVAAEKKKVDPLSVTIH